MKKDLALNIEHADVFLDGTEVLHDICLNIKRGEKCFILGVNGAGKTTLVRTILGYIWPRWGGIVEVLGHRFGKVDLNELRKSVAWVSPFIQRHLETHSNNGVDMVLSGREGTLGFYRQATDEELENVRALLNSLDALSLANKEFSDMSSGEQMKILIARALFTKPDLMIFDEPSVYLDIVQREFFLKTIDNLAKNNPDLTIIFISQRIEDVLPIFTSGAILKDGRIQRQGQREDILTEKVLKQAFGIDIKLIKTESGRFWSVIE